MKTQHWGPLACALSALSLAIPSGVAAIEIGDRNLGIQPRVEVGYMYYEYEQSAVSQTVLSNAGQFGRNFTQEKLKFKDWMPTLGGGVTFFLDRFFLDFSGQKAFSGDDNDTASSSEFIERGDPLNPFGTPPTRSSAPTRDTTRTSTARSMRYLSVSA